MGGKWLEVMEEFMGRRSMMLKNHWRSQYCCPLCLQSSDFLTFNFPGKWFNFITGLVLRPSEQRHDKILLELQSHSPFPLPHGHIPVLPSTTSFSGDSWVTNNHCDNFFSFVWWTYYVWLNPWWRKKKYKIFFSFKLETKSVIKMIFFQNRARNIS